MLNFARFLRVLTVICVGVFGAFRIAPAVACTSDQITLSDNSCVPVQFTMTVTSDDPSDGFDFSFYINAKGTLYIDWGDNSNIQTVTRDKTNQTYSITHRFYQASTIRLSGSFTEYSTKNGRSYSVLRVNNSYLTGISGSLGALFPPIGNTMPLFYETFKDCTNLRGPIPSGLFSGITGAARTGMFNYMFNNCTSLTGYVPYNLFNGITGMSIPASYMNNMFVGASNMDKTCPTGTTQVTTGYESAWKLNSSDTMRTVACQPDATSCDHAYGGACPDLCSWATQLKTNTGLTFPLFATKVTTVAINVRQNGVTCYVPLESGNGGTASLNLTYNGNTYHAGVIDTN
ncbi:MAG: hypothetical protein J5620_03575 [Alphaproteobacteria bacterium]|nr:hypothetical protein [Alphaproteobacteria bacterium]